MGRSSKGSDALPPADLRQSHSGWAGRRGPAGGTRPPLDSAGQPAAYGASGQERERGQAEDVEKGWAALETPALQVEAGFGCPQQHPGFQGPRQVPCASCSQRGRKRVTCARQPLAGAMVGPTFSAPCSAGHPDSPLPVGPTLVPKHLGVGKGQWSLPAPHLLPGKQLRPSSGASNRGVGVEEKATGEACGKQEEETAVASRAAKKSSGPAISPCSSVLPGPRRPPPARRRALGERSSLVPGAAAGWARLRRCSAAGSSLGLAAGRPGPDSPGPSGAGSPLGRRWMPCLQAGAHALPETGSTGGSGLPLLPGDSWIRTGGGWSEGGCHQYPTWEHG